MGFRSCQPTHSSVFGALLIYMRAAGALHVLMVCVGGRVYYILHAVSRDYGVLWRDDLGIATRSPWVVPSVQWIMYDARWTPLLRAGACVCSFGIETSPSARHKGLQIIQWAVASARSQSALFVFSFRIHPAGGVICSPSRFVLCVFNKNEAGCQRFCVAGNLIWTNVAYERGN